MFSRYIFKVTLESRIVSKQAVKVICQQLQGDLPTIPGLLQKAMAILEMQLLKIEVDSHTKVDNATRLTRMCSGGSDIPHKVPL